MLMLEQKLNINDQELLEKQSLLSKYDEELRKVGNTILFQSQVIREYIWKQINNKLR